jgi:hypothetical protein
MNIIEAIQDKNLIGDEISEYQEVLLRAIYGLDMRGKQRRIFQSCTGRKYRRGKEYSEVTAVCGRRSGKSDKIAGNIAVYEAVIKGHEKNLSPGESGIVLVVAQTERLAHVCFRYILAKLEDSPILSKMIVEAKAKEIGLNNGITIACYPCSFRSIRGLSMVCAICDEVAFWRVEGFNPDYEVINAIRPGMSTFPDAKLIKISTPYANQGVIWDDWSNRLRRDGLLVWKATSWEMNPTIPEKAFQRERERDPETFNREYGAEFTGSIKTFLPWELIEPNVVFNRMELPPVPDNRYLFVMDEAYKSRDKFTWGCVHKKDGKIIWDLLRGESRPRGTWIFDDIAKTMKLYRATRVCADQFSSVPTEEHLRARGIYLERIPFTGASKPRIYRSFKEQLRAGQVELLDHPDSLKEIRGLERRITGSGHMQVTAPSGFHDDYADIIALGSFKISHHSLPIFIARSDPEPLTIRNRWGFQHETGRLFDRSTDVSDIVRRHV